jgi:hypothetical protein
MAYDANYIGHPDFRFRAGFSAAAESGLRLGAIFFGGLADAAAGADFWT